MRPEKLKIPTSSNSRLRMWPANRIVTPQQIPSTTSQNDECNIDLEEGLSDDDKSESYIEPDSVLEIISSDDVTSKPQPKRESLRDIETLEMVIKYICCLFSGPTFSNFPKIKSPSNLLSISGCYCQSHGEGRV